MGSGHGGGGSHSGGGFSGRSHGTHGSHGGHNVGGHGYVPHHRHSTIIWLGSRRGYYYNDNGEYEPHKNPKSEKYSKWALFGAFLAVIAIIALFVSLFVTEIKNPLSDVSLYDIQNNYEYYHQLISDADQDHIVDGTITAIKRNSWCEKYYFEYEFVNPNSESSIFPKVKGYIYSIFTEEEIANYSEGDTIEIAIKDSNNLAEPDSIPTLFAEYEWIDDGEVPVIEKWDRIQRVCTACTIVAFLVGIVITSVACKEVQKLESEVAEKVKEKIEKEDSSQKSVRKCAYCGSIQKDGDTTCPNCGSSKFQ